jgi:RNA polymerase sigma-70 factor (ECF subfamily)
VSPCCNELLLRLIAVNQDDLYRYIYTLVPSEADSRDILQETLLAISRKFEQFHSDGPFLPWACRFAYYEVLKHRERAARRVRYFATDVLEVLARERDEAAPLLQARLSALDDCLEKLPAADRKLLRERYASKLTLDEVAVRVKQSRRTLLRNLKRLREWLHDCVERQPEMREVQ